MGKRLSEDDIKSIREAFKQTGTIRGVSRKTGIRRKTVRKYLESMGCPVVNAPAVKKRPSKLDPYKPKIGYLVREKKLTAIRVFEEIQQLGYDGGYTILKEYVRLIRPKNKKIPRPPIDHPPGYEAQMDWSPHNVIIGGKAQVVQTGSIVLCFSRWLFIRHFVDQTLESVIRLHEQAFAELGAVPEIITYDNMTTVGRHVGPGEIWINPTFKRFAQKYGFKIVILRPGAKERHGKVERHFHYIENNFLAGREFDDLADLNDRADQWRYNKANVRVHGTLRQRPVDMLVREMPYLSALPASLSEAIYKEVDRLVHLDFCIAIDTNRYSVSPCLVGETAKVRLYKDHLEIWVKNKFDCKHEYENGRHQRKVLPEHQEIYKKMTGQRQLLEEAFLLLGEPSKIFYEGLLKQRKGAAGYHLSRILQYADRHGADVVAGALAHAAKYNAYSADAVFRIINGKELKGKAKNSAVRAPKNYRQWLRSYVVEKQKLDRYDKLVEKEDKDDSNFGR